MHGWSCFGSHFRARSEKALQEELLTMQDFLLNARSCDDASFEQRPVAPKCSLLAA